MRVEGVVAPWMVMSIAAPLASATAGVTTCGRVARLATRQGLVHPSYLLATPWLCGESCRHNGRHACQHHLLHFAFRV